VPHIPPWCLVANSAATPASALKAEMRKRIYVYFGINLSPTGTPKAPKRLRLGAGGGKAAKARRLSAGEYEVTISYSFRIGNDGYYWTPGWCTKDTEPQDGLGLPGHHGCGAPTISATAYYLG
jgi:hypothetical protein